MNIEIRSEPLDRPAGRELVAAFATEIAGRHPGWNPSIGPSAEPDEFRPPAGMFLVGYADGRPVGCGGFKRLELGMVEVKRLTALVLQARVPASKSTWFTVPVSRLRWSYGTA